jgi:hypothetical protein
MFSAFSSPFLLLNSNNVGETSLKKSCRFNPGVCGEWERGVVKGTKIPFLDHVFAAKSIEIYKINRNLILLCCK